MPNWINRTIDGTLICIFCGSVVAYLYSSFVCTNPQCEKHDDEPVHQTQGNAGVLNSNLFTVTSTGTALSSTSTSTTTTL